MDRITQLVHVVHPVKKTDFSPDDRAPKLKALYQGLLEGRFKSESEAIEFFYGKDPHAERYFHSLKYRLFNFLSNSILGLDPDPDDSEVIRACYACYKNYAAFQILKAKWARDPAMTLAERALKKALKYHFTSVALECATSLRYHHALNGNNKRYKKYNKIVKGQRGIKYAEDEAEAIFSHLMLQFSKSKANTPENINLIDTYAEDLKQLLDKNSSYRLYLIGYDVMINSNRLKGNYNLVIQNARAALKFFQSLPFKTTGSLFSFNYHIFTSSIRIKDYETAKVASAACLEVSIKGSRNWMIVHYYLAILGFHAGDYILALESVAEGKKHLHKHIGLRENFLILDAYSSFFAKIGKVPGQKRERFRVAKFINEVPEFSKDKRGMNINILIIQILYLLQGQKHGQIIDRMEALEAYRYRHLRRDSTFRSNCFINMLKQLERGRFHPVAIERHTKPYLKKLATLPLKDSLQDLEVEPVPYESLWEIILEMVER